MSRNNEPSFPQGLRAAVPVLIGYIPAGTAFGLLAESSHMLLTDTLGFSVVVFAGASQFMAIGLIQTGATAMQIILATFLLNFRHFLMSASLADKIRKGHPALKAVLGFLVTDETFAVASAEQREIGPGYFAGLGLAAWLAWITGTTGGFLLGSFIPSRLRDALAVALYALFAGLLVPLLKKRLANIFLAILAGLVHMLLIFSGLAPGWAFVVAIVIPALFGAIVVRNTETPEVE